MCIRMPNDHMRSLKALQSMSEFGGLWQHQNNPACTNSVIVFRLLKLDTIRKKSLWSADSGGEAAFGHPGRPAMHGSLRAENQSFPSEWRREKHTKRRDASTRFYSNN